MKATRKTITPKQIKHAMNQGGGYPSVFSLRVEDKENNRFTDVWLSVSLRRGRVKFLMSHERGYPSEQKGITEKEITGNWISKELPRV